MAITLNRCVRLPILHPPGGLTAAVKVGNRVMFEEDGDNVSNIYNKETKEVTIPIEEVNMQYEFDMFLPVPKGKSCKPGTVVTVALGERSLRTKLRICPRFLTGWCEHCKAGALG